MHIFLSFLPERDAEGLSYGRSAEVVWVSFTHSLSLKRKKQRVSLGGEGGRKELRWYWIKGGRKRCGDEYFFSPSTEREIQSVSLIWKKCRGCVGLFHSLSLQREMQRVSLGGKGGMQEFRWYWIQVGRKRCSDAYFLSPSSQKEMQRV